MIGIGFDSDSVVFYLWNRSIHICKHRQKFKFVPIYRNKENFEYAKNHDLLHSYLFFGLDSFKGFFGITKQIK